MTRVRPTGIIILGHKGDHGWQRLPIAGSNGS